jgi:hypothetical protein
MRHIIHQYGVEQGALEVQYIEEYFQEFRNRKTADEIMRRLTGREHLILLSMAPIPDQDDDRLIPVAFKVGHELRADETDAQLAQLVSELHDCVDFAGRKVFYSWIGGTRGPWRSHGHYRALTEQQELWAHEHGFHELVVKTKNKFYPMRATLAHLRFNVVRYLHNSSDNTESKVYLSKHLTADMLDLHRTLRTLFAGSDLDKL